MCGIWAIFGSDGDITHQFSMFQKIAHRGPDAFKIETILHFEKRCLGSHRLAINGDLWGMQPIRLFRHPSIYLIYNGEIYNYKEKQFGFKLDSQCDGEVIIHLYNEGGIEFAAKHLDGVFCFCLLDTKKRKVFLGRDTFGVKPLFRINTKSGFMAVCSEAKGSITVEAYISVGLMELQLNDVKTHTAVDIFPPGHTETYVIDSTGGAFFQEKTLFHKVGEPPYYTTLSVHIAADDVRSIIKQLLTESVNKRLMAERRIGYMLSAGLDSSLVTALTVRSAKEMNLGYKIQTFSVGMAGSTDLPAARKVADFLGTDHHEVLITDEQGIAALNDVIYHLETYDITTVRASTGMYLLSKYIKENTDTTVIMLGDGSDEVCQGYIYFHKAPSPEAADTESRRLCNDIQYFDVARADRTTAAWGLESRVPFLDHRFTSYYLSLPADMRAPQKGIEKYLLRSAFSGSGLLPEEILWRPKEDFADGVSSVKNSWHTALQSHIDILRTNRDVDEASARYTHNTPRSKEALFYRQIFEKYYPGFGKWVPYFWMPKWTNAEDPSARILEHYKQ